MPEKKISFKNNRGQKLAGVLHTPQKKTDRAIIMAHGFGVDRDEYGEFVSAAKEFCGNGFAVLRFDFGGCGESEGKFVDMTIYKEVEDLKSAIKFIRDKGYQRIGILGASTGGLISIIVTSQENINVLVLWNPNVYPKKTFEKYFSSKSTTWKKEIKKGSFILEKRDKRQIIVGKKFWDEAQKINTLPIAPKIKAKTIIIHGDEDTIVNYEDSWELFKKIEGAKIEIIKGADHGFHDKENSRLVTEMSLGWFEEFL